VIVTRAGKGAVVYHQGAVHHVDAFATRDPVDPTGCGDTFMAGYLFSRLGGRDPAAAARFGAVAAALKLGHVGPFEGSCESVEALL
jgi:sugar/nucleoside kinase (ribokinase family)